MPQDAIFSQKSSHATCFFTALICIQDGVKKKSAPIENKGFEFRAFF